MYRYIGNKTKLLSEITDLVAKYVPVGGTVADVMAGTGTVAAELRRCNYKVIASDIMTYSKHHLSVQLLMDSEPAFEGLSSELGSFVCYNEVLEYLNNLTPVCGYFYQEFSPEGTPANGCPPRKYFTSDNAKHIDAVRMEINRWVEKRLITSLEESLLKHDLIMAANEVANISGTYGYFLSKFHGSALMPFSMKASSFEGGSIENTVLQGYAEELSSSITADLCYIDPPYIKRQYAANYHILETLARGDEPEAQGKSGLRPWRDQYSNLCTKTKSMDSFRQIFSKMNCPVFLISYSEDGLFPVSELMDTFAEFGKVSLKEIEYKRFRSNRSSLGKAIHEYIITLEKDGGVTCNL